MRLIDADALRAAVMKILNNSIGGAYDGVYQCLEAINNAPTVKPQKIVTIPPELIEKLASCVVDIVGNIDWEKAIEAYKARPQGEWIDTGHKEEYWAEEYQCSICGAKDHWHKFCPNCGAPMKEDSDEVADDKHL